jgi:hypothetical protein
MQGELYCVITAMVTFKTADVVITVDNIEWETPGKSSTSSGIRCYLNVMSPAIQPTPRFKVVFQVLHRTITS